MPNVTAVAAPDVLNSDGSVTRIITQTVIFGAAEYLKMQTALQNQITATQAQLTALQPIAIQVQSALNTAASLSGTSTAQTL